MAMKSYVYEILHIPTGDVYVGSKTSNKELSITEYCGSSTSTLFRKKTILSNPNDYQKTILKIFKTKKGAVEYEHGSKGLIKRYIDEYGQKCHNKQYFKNEKSAHFMIDANISDETRQKMSVSHKGMKHSDETKNKISDSHKAKNINFFGENNPMFGKKHSELSKKKISSNRNYHDKYKCPYCEMTKNPTQISKHIKSEHPCEIQWKDLYTKKERKLKFLVKD
jgi:hypothetical protein